jgi:hypothetical protein
MGRGWAVCVKRDAGAASWLDAPRRAKAGEKSSTVDALTLFNVMSGLESTASRLAMGPRCEDGVVSYFRFGGGIGSRSNGGGSPRDFLSSAACALTSSHCFPLLTSRT